MWNRRLGSCSQGAADLGPVQRAPAHCLPPPVPIGPRASGLPLRMDPSSSCVFPSSGTSASCSGRWGAWRAEPSFGNGPFASACARLAVGRRRRHRGRSSIDARFRLGQAAPLDLPTSGRAHYPCQASLQPSTSQALDFYFMALTGVREAMLRPCLPLESTASAGILPSNSRSSRHDLLLQTVTRSRARRQWPARARTAFTYCSCSVSDKSAQFDDWMALPMHGHDFQPHLIPP